VEVRRNVGGRGVMAVIKGRKPGRTVALRADFDALELQDEKDVPYKSQVPGVMHACAHDCHAASLLGVANVLSKNADSFDGEVRLFFQHAEESAPGGAIAMIGDGCLDGVNAIFGTHITSQMPVGKYGYRSGEMMAIADKFIIDLQGKGGHGAAPHHTVDTILLAANVIVSLQQIVSRRVNPMAQAVLSIGRVEAGAAFNVIADSAKILGTVRTFDKALQEAMIGHIEQIIKGCCDAAGATYSFSYEKGYPAVVNHPAETDMAVESLTKLVGSEHLLELDPLMGGEDFSYYLERVPGTFLYTGGGNTEKGIVYPHHHPKFDIDEDAILYASRGLLTIALDYLGNSN
ncbi:MAG: amidohydrolase, partial [Defluviitaleaceae bacterium]|nr:amidohydrolase [Defluviitaleaceae bacterium]